MPARILFGCLGLLLTGIGTTLADPPEQDWFPKAPPLPAPQGQVLHVSNVRELYQAAAEVPVGGTIFVADGHYKLDGFLEITTPQVTLRSASGNRHAVILDGVESPHGELIGLSADDITVADLTIQNAPFNGFKITERGTDRAVIYNCVIHNIWQRGVKASHVPPARSDDYPQACRVQYCLFYNDHPKRYADDPTDTAETYRGNYIGGIDVKNTIDWTISDNVFVGIQGRTREGRACIYISEEGRRCLIERNIIIDCDVGIALGNPTLGGKWLHCHDCLVRNNFVTRCPETGILACYTHGCQILGNTVHEPDSRFGRLIWVQQTNDGLQVANNLLSGPEIRLDTESEIQQSHNLAKEDLSEQFVDASQGNLHLRAAVQGVLDSGLRRFELSHDLDHQPRLDTPDIGADEFRLLAQAPQQASTEQPAWVEPMQKVHAQFQGNENMVVQLGDSITYSLAFWSPMQWSDPSPYLSEDGLPKKPKDKLWKHVIQGARLKGSQHGNYSGWTVGNLLKVVDDVLAEQKPAVALVMIGTNDIAGGKVPSGYRQGLKTVLEKCLKSHCIPIVNTIPPRRDRQEAVEKINGIIREVAKELKVPLVDYYEAILERQGDWDGTLISKDGVHPTGGKTHIYTEENLKQSGYALRNWVNFLKFRQVYFWVLRAK